MAWGVGGVHGKHAAVLRFSDDEVSGAVELARGGVKYLLIGFIRRYFCPEGGIARGELQNADLAVFVATHQSRSAYCAEQ